MGRKKRTINPKDSVANKGFVPPLPPKKDIDNLLGHDDFESVRLDKGREEENRRDPTKVRDEAEAIKKIGGRKIMYILEESLNDFVITGKAPSEHEAAVKYYSDQLRTYKLRIHPEENGLIHFYLAFLFSEENRKPNLHISNVKKDLDDRAKMIENTLFHLNKARVVFSTDSHPIMFAVICILTGQMYRERITLMRNRCFLGRDRGTVSESIAQGLAQVLEAFEVFAYSKQHAAEHAICAVEAGWLYLLQSEEPAYLRNPLIREQAISYLERAMELIHECYNPFRDEKPRLWDPQDTSSHPRYIRVLLQSKSLSHLEGMAKFLLGRVYMDWGLNVQYQEEAFNQFCLCTKPKFLTPDNEYWGEAHHKAAIVILTCPNVVDPDYVKPKDLSGPGAIYPGELYLDAAISHLSLALRCTALTGSQRMDIYFHRAQAYFTKFYNITDRVPAGASIMNALLDQETHGIEIMENIESNLLSAVELVTPASTQSPQDGLIFYFASLKLADFRVLEAGIRHKKDAEERDELIRDALAHIVNAMISRSLEENMDLHHVAISQMAQLLLSARRGHGASKCYGKSLLSLSCIVNRCGFYDAYIKHRIQDEIVRLTSHALTACSKYVTWEKRHIGTQLFNCSITPGYASWSFEAEPVWGDNVPYLRSADNRVPPREAPPDRKMRVPVTAHDAVDKVAAIEAIDDTGSVSTESFRAIGKTSFALDKSRGKSGVTSLTALNLHKIKPNAISILEEDALDLEKSNAGAVATSPTKRPLGLPPLSAYGQAPLLSPDGKPVPSPYACRKRRRVPWPEEFEYVREQQAAAGHSKMYAGPISLVPTHHNLKVGHSKEKSFDKGFAATLEKVRVEEGDDDSNDESSQQDANKLNGDSSTGSRKKRVKVLGSPNASQKYSKKKVRIRDPTSSWDVHVDSEEDPEGVDLGYFGAWIARARTLYFESKAVAISTARNTIESIKSIQHQIKDKYIEFLGPPKVFVKGGDMWASKTAWYVMMSMSRMSRLQLVARGTALLAIQGERVRVVVREEPPEVQQAYFTIKQNLRRATKSLIVMPQTLREMMQRPFGDLRAIFDSQTVHYKLLREMEDLMDLKNIGQSDCFVSMVHIAPCLRRELASFDRSIFDVETFNECIKYEAAVTEKKVQQRFEAVHAIEKTERKWGETHYAHPAAAHASRKLPITGIDQDAESLDSLTSSLVAGERGSVAASDGYGPVLRSYEKYEPEQLNPPPLPPKRPTAVEEAKEDAKLGKMTYSFSHILDGSYEGDIRRQLSKYLSANELFLQWHLPSAADQNIMVVMAWRQAVMKLGKSDANKTASGGTANTVQLDDEDDEDDEDDPAAANIFVPGNRRTEVSENKSAAKSGKQARNNVKSTKPSSILGEEKPKTAEEIELELGIVVEIARCDLDVNQFQNIMRAYLEALHCRPQPLRQSKSTDALRILSGYLAINELLLMAPSTTTSIVICCPPPMRLVPWHLLLIEVQQGSVSLDIEESYTLAQGPIHSTPSSPSPELKSKSGKMTDDYAINGGNVAKAPSLMDYGLIVVHLGEKYLIRLGPTLAIWEFCCYSSAQLSHAVGLHRLAAVDGESLDNRSYGLRSASSELACVTSTWSGDPEDYKVFSEQAAIPSRLRTMFSGSAHLTKPVVVGDRKTDDSAMMELGRLKAERAMEKEKKRKAREKRNKKKAEELKKQAAEGRYVYDHSSSESEESSESSSDDEDEKLLQTIRLSTCRVLHIAAPKAPPTKKLENRFAAITLPMSSKANRVRQREQEARFKTGIILSGEDKTSVDGTSIPIKVKISKREQEYLRDSMSSRDIISQLFLRNCGLCVLSRFGLTDDLEDASPRNCDPNVEFIESVHMAGANTVLYPLWSCNDQGGLGTLANLLFFIRFYTDLPTYSKKRYSVCHAVRRAQLWLKEVTGEEAIEFISKAPLPRKIRQDIIEELTSHILTVNQSPLRSSAQINAVGDSSTASYYSSEAGRASAGDSALDTALKSLNAHNVLVGISTPAEATMYSAVPPSKRPITKESAVQQIEFKTEGSGPGEKKQFFNHFIYWGMFTVSGHGGNIHHPDLAGDEGQARDLVNKGGREFADDPDLDNMAFEVRFLRMEGRVDEAYELEQVMKRMQVNNIKKRLQKVRDTGLLAGRKILDGLDRLDKALLDQDSDEISVSDGEGEKRSDIHQPIRGKRSIFGSGNSVHPDPSAPAHKLKPLRAIANPLDDAPVGPSSELKSTTESVKSANGGKHRSSRKLPKKVSGKEPESARLESRLNRFEEKVTDNPDEENDDEPVDLNALGVAKLALKNARALRSTFTDAKKAVSSEVRSYSDATQTAQQMLSKLPPPTAAAKACTVS